MVFLQLLALVSFLVLLPLLSFLFLTKTSTPKKQSTSHPTATIHPKSYPLIGSLPAIIANNHRLNRWTADILQISPSATFVLHRPFNKFKFSQPILPSFNTS
ncbi:Cytochrome P450 94A2 [Morella rubra]|uniref:Cytochrome P450 94A2 n=1 Tax=Morella rubra TaxID=262757 RepID=A0A6A1VCH9_9ROSI|nr:Cytochrome P450 94A2 [Morella rubra]